MTIMAASNKPSRRASLPVALPAVVPGAVFTRV
jgi:hypothetical protein